MEQKRKAAKRDLPSESEDEEPEGMEPKRKSDSEDEVLETDVMDPKRKSREAFKHNQPSNSEDDETTLVGFAYEAAIKSMSVSSQLKEKLLELCRRVKKTLMLTEKQLKKVRAFKCEIEDLDNMQSQFKFSLGRGIYRADEGERPFSTSAYTDEEVCSIRENYTRFCKEFGFHPKEDLNVFLPCTFSKRNGFDNLSHKQEQVFCRYLSHNINRPPRSVYKKFVKMYFFYRKGHYSVEEDELLLSWHKMNPGKHIYSVLGRILHRNRQLVRRRTLRLLGEEDPAKKPRKRSRCVDGIKMHESVEHPDWTLDEDAWGEIAEANGECNVKQLNKSCFQGRYPSVKVSSVVSSNKFRSSLITKLISLKNPTWENVDWIKMGQDCFNVGAVRVYSVMRTLTKKYVPREHWKDLAAALKIIKDEQHLFDGPENTLEVEDPGAVSDSASSAVSSYSQPATLVAQPDVGQHSRNTEREDGVQVKENEDIFSESDSREFLPSMTDSYSSLGDESEAPWNEKEKLGEEIMKTEELDVSCDTDRIAHTVVESPKKRKKIRKKSEKNMDSCNVKCEDQSVENSDGGASRKNTVSGDSISILNFDANPLDTAVSEYDSHKKERKVEVDQLIDDGIAHTVADSPKKRKKVRKKFKNAESSDGGASRKNAGSEEPLSIVGNLNFDENPLDTAVSEYDSDTKERKVKLKESDSKMSPKKKLGDSDQLIDDKITHTVADSPKKRKKVRKKSEKILSPVL